MSIFMKKAIASLIVVSLIAIGFSGCGSAQTPSQSAPAETSTAPAESSQVQSEAEPASSEAEGGASGVVTVWGWDESEILKDFSEEHIPGIEINYVTISQADLVQRIQTTLASGAQMPDIAWLEATVRGRLFALNCWENLSQAPYNIDKNVFTTDQIPVSVGEDGDLYGMPLGPVPSAMAYKRSLAKQYFGTDDPEELFKKLDTWDKYIAEGQRVTTESGGSVSMFAGLSDLYNVFIGQTIIPYTIGDKLNVDASLRPALTRLIEFKKAGVVDTLEANSPALFASYADNSHIFYPAAQWAPRWIIKQNDQREGEWGIMELAEGSVNWGGAVMSIPTTALNKEGAIAVMELVLTNPISAIPRRDELQVFSAIRSVYDDPDFYSFKDPFFAGQDVDRLFARTILPKMNEGNVRPLNKYDVEVKAAVNTALTNINASPDGNVDIDNLIKQIEDDILSMCPELSR